jgi:hypothetical protein
MPDITTLFPLTTFPLHGRFTSSGERVGNALCAAEESGFKAPQWAVDLCADAHDWSVLVEFAKVDGEWTVTAIRPDVPEPWERPS